MSKNKQKSLSKASFSKAESVEECVESNYIDPQRKKDGQIKLDSLLAPIVSNTKGDKLPNFWIPRKGNDKSINPTERKEKTEK